MVDSRAIIFGVLFSFAVGFYFGQMADFDSFNANSDSASESYDPKVTLIERKLFEIEREELADFNSLQDEKERYLKANEVYSKALRIFSSNLNLRINEPLWASLRYAENEDIKEKDIPAQKQTKPVKPKLAKQAEVKPLGDKSPVSIFSQIVQRMQEPETFNEKGMALDPDKFIEEATLITIKNETLKSLSGKFAGSLSLFESESDNDFNIQNFLEFKQSRWTGELRASIRSKRSVLSRLRKKGNNSAFFSHPKSKNGIILKMNDSGFLHLTLDPVRKVFSGYYYVKSPVSGESFKVTGRVNRLKVVTQ